MGEPWEAREAFVFKQNGLIKIANNSIVNERCEELKICFVGSYPGPDEKLNHERK
jgi:hypothetical protein